MKLTIKSANARVKANSAGGFLGDIRAELKRELKFEKAEEIAQGAVNAMADKIRAKISRDGSEDKLINALTVTATQHKNGSITFGVGDKAELQKEAPHWYVINYGHAHDSNQPYVPPMNRGGFSSAPFYPVAGGKGQRWYGGEGRDRQKTAYFMKPTAIFGGEFDKAFHYIEAGQKYIQKRLARFNGYKSR